MNCKDFVSYKDIKNGLEYHENAVHWMWKLLRRFKKDCRQAFAIRSVRMEWNRSFGGPLEVEFFCDSAAKVPSLSMVSAIVNNHFEILLFPTSGYTFAYGYDPESKEYTHHGFGVRIEYWRFSEN